MKSLSEIRAWVEFQQSAQHAGIESFVYMLGLIDKMRETLKKFSGDSVWCEHCAITFELNGTITHEEHCPVIEVRALLEELKQ